jgi:hypothetical protein
MIPKVSLLLILSQLFLLLKATNTRHFFQVLPSTVWVVAMLTPFCLLQKYFPINLAFKQGVAITLVAVVLQICDYYSLRLKSRTSSNMTPIHNLNFDVFFAVALTISIVIPLLHYIIAKQIPLVYQISGKYSPEQIADFRENFIKLLDVPSYLKIIPNYVFAFFGPYSLLVLIDRRKYLEASSLFCWCVFYALSSTADLPLIIFLGTTLLGAIPLLSQTKVKVASIVVASGLLLTIFSGVILIKGINSSSRSCAIESSNVSTPGDVWRSCSGENIVWFNIATDRIGYRVFITPVEVSNLWYRYYGEEEQRVRSIGSIFNRDLSQTPANLIGNWSFVEKFPGKYKKSNSSYSSLDADASSFGPQFFLLMLIGLFFMRLSATFHFRFPSQRTAVISGFMVAQLSIFPFQSSIQAILFSQGFLIILGVYMLQVRFDKRSQQKN